MPFDCRLTAAKEAGATIDIDGKKVALGVPGAKPPSDAAAQSGEAYPFIPLRRGGNADEAAAAMLLYVSLFFLFFSLFSLSSLSDMGSDEYVFVSILFHIAWHQDLRRM